MCGVQYGPVACCCYCGSSVRVSVLQWFVEFDPLYYSCSFDFRSCSCSSFPLLLTLLLVLLLLEVLLFPPPLFVVIDCYHKTNNRDHPPRVLRIDPSLYRVVWYLSSSLYVPFRSYSCSSSFLLWLLLLPSLLWSWNQYLSWFGRTSLAGRTSYTLIRHYLIDRYDYNVSIARGTTTDLCVRTDMILYLKKLMYRTLIRRNTIKRRWFGIQYDNKILSTP